MKVENQKTVDLIDSLERQSAHQYHAEPPLDMPYIPPNTTLAQKAGYLFIRRYDIQHIYSLYMYMHLYHLKNQSGEANTHCLGFKYVQRI